MGGSRTPAASKIGLVMTKFNSQKSLLLLQSIIFYLLLGCLKANFRPMSRNSLTNLILITAFFLNSSYDVKVTRSLVTRLGLCVRLSTYSVWPGILPIWLQCFNPARPFSSYSRSPRSASEKRKDRNSIVFLQFVGFTGCIIFHDGLTDIHLHCQLCCIDQYPNKKVSHVQTGFVSTWQVLLVYLPGLSPERQKLSQTKTLK